MKKEKPTIKVVEWSGSNHDDQYWHDKFFTRKNLEKPLQIKPMTNILDFDFKL